MLEPLLNGTWVTIQITVLAGLIAWLVALLVGMARLSPIAAVRVIAGFYVELFRGTSALVQLYLAYFVLPFAGLSLTPFTAAVAVLGLNTGSYGAEVVRSAVQSVPNSQREAAWALGLGRWATWRLVVLPQALVIMLPSMSTLLIDLLKMSSLVSLITLADLVFEAQSIRKATGETAQIFGLTLIMYFILASAIVSLMSAVERRAGRAYRRTPRPGTRPAREIVVAP